MESWLIRITDYLLVQSWQIAVLTVVVAIVSFLLRNRSAHVRYLIWLVVLAKCLMPPLYSIPLAVLPQEHSRSSVPTPLPVETLFVESRAAQAPVTERDGSTSVETKMTSSPKAMEKSTTYNIRAWLGIGWLVGAVALLFFNLLNALHTQIWLQRQRKAPQVESKRNMRDFLSAHGFKHMPSIWLLDGINQPFVWGLVRGSVYLPAELLNVKDPKRWMSLLGHELSHIVRFDAAINSLQVVAQAIFWFHPFVWWANKKIRAEREKCCDEMAIARLNALPEDYSTAIVETLAAKYESVRPVPSLAVAGPVSNIEERIKTMLRPGKKFYKRPSLVAATVVLLLALLIVPTGLVVTARAEKKAAPEREEDLARELMRHRRELQERGRHIERELEGLRDDQDEEARELQAELREIREKLRHIERELGGPKRERREAEMPASELLQRRRELQEKGRYIERELEGLRDDQDEEARELQAELREIRDKLRHIERELGGPERERRPDPEHRPDRERRPVRERGVEERQLLRRLLERLERMEREIRVLHEEIVRLKWQLREKKVVDKRDVEPDKPRPRLKYRPLPDDIEYFKGYLVGTITSMDEKGIMLKVTGVTAGEGNRADNPGYMKGENMRLLFYCFMGKDGKYNPDRSLVRAVNELREKGGLITAKVYAERDEALLLTRVWAGDQKDPERPD